MWYFMQWIIKIAAIIKQNMFLATFADRQGVEIVLTNHSELGIIEIRIESNIEHETFSLGGHNLFYLGGL